ncbi:hypothetical protein LguiB_032370 [Lonicera macranthoides]
MAETESNNNNNNQESEEDERNPLPRRLPTKNNNNQQRQEEEDQQQWQPQQLAERYDIMGEKEMYFFTPRDRKYKRGARPNRAAGNGYWKPTGAERKVKHKGKIIGHVRTLVYYEGQSCKGDKTNWKMQEFRVEGTPARVKTSPDDKRLDDWVLCLIYERTGKWRRAGERDDDDGDEPAERNNDNNSETSNNLNQIGDTNVLVNNPSNEYIPPDIDVALSQLPQFDDYPSNIPNFIGTQIPNHSAQPISYSHRDPNHFQPASYGHPDLNLHSTRTTSYSHPDPNQHLVQPTEYSHPDPTHHLARPTSYSYLDPNHSVRPVYRQSDLNHLSAQPASHSHLYPTHHSARPTSYSYLDPNRSVQPVTNREPDPNHPSARHASHSHLYPNRSVRPVTNREPDPSHLSARPTSHSHLYPTHHSAGPTSYSYLDPNRSALPVTNRELDPNHPSARHASHSHLYPNCSVWPVTNREPDPSHLSARPTSHSHLYPTHHSVQYGQEDIIRSRNIKDVWFPNVQENVWGIGPSYSYFDYPKPLMELDALDNNDPNLYPNLVNNEALNNFLAPTEDSSTNNAPDLEDNNTRGSQFGSVSEQKESNN